MWALEDDLHAGTHAQAINPDDPWYYYYQFVSHRTVTSVGYKTAQSYINDTMGTLGQLTSYSDMDLDGASDDLSRSQYYGMMPAFWARMLRLSRRPLPVPFSAISRRA